MLELTAPIPQNRHSSLSPVDRLPSRRQAKFEAAKFEAAKFEAAKFEAAKFEAAKFEALDAEIYCGRVFAAVGHPLDA
jgi:hypothetical protein